MFLPPDAQSIRLEEESLLKEALTFHLTLNGKTGEAKPRPYGDCRFSYGMGLVGAVDGGR